MCPSTLKLNSAILCKERSQVKCIGLYQVNFSLLTTVKVSMEYFLESGIPELSYGKIKKPVT